MGAVNFCVCKYNTGNDSDILIGKDREENNTNTNEMYLTYNKDIINELEFEFANSKTTRKQNDNIPEEDIFVHFNYPDVEKIILIQKFIRGYLYSKRYEREKIFYFQENKNTEISISEPVIVVEEKLLDLFSNIKSPVRILYDKNSIKNNKKLFVKKFFLNDTTITGFVEDLTNKKLKINGICKCENNLGKKLYGEIGENSYNGYAILINPDGAIYEGYWNDGFQSSVGRENWLDGSYFEGSYYQGKRNGIGYYKSPDGSTYEGEWKNNQINGYGIINYKNGNSYYGQFIKGEYSGYGEYNWRDGRVYIGNFENNKENGFGFLKDSMNNKFYLGFWKNSRYNGIGCTIQNNKMKFYKWKDGKKIETYRNKVHAFRDLSTEETKYLKYFLTPVSEIVKNRNFY